jgi:hypothetical protein
MTNWKLSLKNLSNLMSYSMKHRQTLAARRKNQEVKNLLALVNIELAKMDHGHPMYARRVREFDQAMITLTKAKWHTTLAMESGDKEAWQKASSHYKGCKTFSQGLLEAIQSGSSSPLVHDEHTLTSDQGEITFADGVPLIPEINPVIVLQGSDYDMGYQYARQLVQIFGPWILERKAGRDFSDAQIAIMQKWEAQIREHAPEIIPMCEGWAAGASDAGVPMSYYDVLDLWTGHEPPLPSYIGDEGLPELGPPLCSGLAAWGRATTDGKLVTGSVGDHDPGYTVTVVAFPETGNNTIYAPFGATGDIPAGGPLYFFGHPGMNDKGLAYVHHGGGPKMIEPKGAWGYGIRRAVAVLHILRFADSAEQAREMEMAFPIGDVGQGDPGTAGGYWADSQYGFVVESRQDPVIIRESGLMGERDFLYAANSPLHPDVSQAAWMQGDQDWVWDKPGGWRPKEFVGFSLSSLENPFLMGLKFGYYNSYYRNRQAFDILDRGVGRIDLEYMKMIYRHSGSIPAGAWKKVAAAYGKGEWELAVGNNSNALVVIMKPEDGIYAHCVGKAARGLTPLSPRNSSPIHAETNAFFELKLGDSPEALASSARQKAQVYIASARSDMARLESSDPAYEPLQELLEIAQGELERGEGHEKAAQNATDDGALYDWARATRAFTRSQVRARQVTNALVPPPSKPEDFGL